MRAVVQRAIVDGGMKNQHLNLQAILNLEQVYLQYSCLSE